MKRNFSIEEKLSAIGLVFQGESARSRHPQPLLRRRPPDEHPDRQQQHLHQPFQTSPRRLHRHLHRQRQVLQPKSRKLILHTPPS